jgi:hypothetical protein
MTLGFLDQSPHLLQPTRYPLSEHAFVCSDHKQVRRDERLESPSDGTAFLDDQSCAVTPFGRLRPSGRVILGASGAHHDRRRQTAPVRFLENKRYDLLAGSTAGMSEEDEVLYPRQRGRRDALTSERFRVKLRNWRAQAESGPFDLPWHRGYDHLESALQVFEVVNDPAECESQPDQSQKEYPRDNREAEHIDGWASPLLCHNLDVHHPSTLAR